jgi:hypothetical protein
MPPIGRPEFALMRVVAERLLVAFPQGHPFADGETVAPKALDGRPFIMYWRYESRYFHDLVVTLFTRADTLPRSTSARFTPFSRWWVPDLVLPSCRKPRPT